MEIQFTKVDDIHTLDEWLDRSHQQAVVLFKHSSTCPISSAAYREMKQLGTEVGIVVVQRARDVSREVAARTGVRHESPQVFIIRNGQSVWTASHWNITSDAVAAALREQQGSMTAKG
ncbi:MAG TPA: bacillithiol system redox-active protein YtxJ [Pyrinomonadaceae bacterium]|jgi:bacillithiol system protein YtxJ|nr:bacillithiol system redox-active protein YtxJ [Pyrinomonadaceae bacterium]